MPTLADTVHQSLVSTTGSASAEARALLDDIQSNLGRLLPDFAPTLSVEVICEEKGTSRSPVEIRKNRYGLLSVSPQHCILARAKGWGVYATSTYAIGDVAVAPIEATFKGSRLPAIRLEHKELTGGLVLGLKIDTTARNAVEQWRDSIVALADR